MGSPIIRENFEKLNDKNRDQVMETTKNEVMGLLKQQIRPEFLNRIDEIVMFSPLTEKEIGEIVEIQMKGIEKMLADNDVKLDITPAARTFLTKEGYDPEFGARPVKRAIHKYVLNELSKDLIANTIDKSKPIIVDAENDHLIFRNADSEK